MVSHLACGRESKKKVKKVKKDNEKGEEKTKERILQPRKRSTDVSGTKPKEKKNVRENFGR